MDAVKQELSIATNDLQVALENFFKCQLANGGALTARELKYISKVGYNDYVRRICDGRDLLFIDVYIQKAAEMAIKQEDKQ